MRGGTVGLILDARGRPLQLPEDRATCQKTISEWVKAMHMYAEPEPAMA